MLKDVLAVIDQVLKDNVPHSKMLSMLHNARRQAKVFDVGREFALFLLHVYSLDDWRGEFEWTDEAKRVLQTIFKHSAFRPNQIEIINAVMAGVDCMAVLPTGGGKSLLFQVDRDSYLDVLIYF